MVKYNLDVMQQLQNDFPLEKKPYKTMAARLDMSETQLLEITKEYIKRGLVKKIALVLNHRRLGINANAMCVWKVPRKRINAAGKIMASFPEVTHCYQRPTFPHWPYSLFTMVHGANRKECEGIVEKISLATEIFDYQTLYSTKELKKTTMRYFL